ncbi:MAG: triose-phosphate isomerase [Planctomycetota bacterium]|jgi:triosephosphate isomerase|nr:triose-phosphate isomerase [Planctomycetota bacterium]
MARPDKLYIGTNTKMYKTIAQTADFLDKLGRHAADIPRDKMELFVIPSFTALETAAKYAAPAHIVLGAQNMGWEDEGQFTGEISPLMLKEIGVRVVEIGHSERRHVLGETDEQENRKVLCAFRHGFVPLLCIGETGTEKDAGISDEILRIQLKRGLHGVTPIQAKELWIAYEPVWAIGVSGIPASKEYAEEKHQVIRRTLVELFGGESGGAIPILYGGSVNNENASSLIAMPAVDGLFIGRCAWDADNLNRIIRDVMPIWGNKR